jgi:hypothetical protein
MRRLAGYLVVSFAMVLAIPLQRGMIIDEAGNRSEQGRFLSEAPTTATRF